MERKTEPVMEKNQVLVQDLISLDPVMPEASTRPFQFHKNLFLKSIQSEFVSLMTERAVSSILSFSL